MMCKEKLPSTILNMTNWLSVSDGNIGPLCGNFPYLNQIWKLNISHNEVTEICESLLKEIIKGKTIRWFDISGNKLQKISPGIREGQFEKIWLSGNRFDCNCDMLWMAKWLANTTTPSSGHVVQDYKQVLCSTGKHKGTPVYTLNASFMNCLPTKLPAWGIGLIAAASVLVIATVLTIVIIARRWNEVKFWMYIHFDILDKNDDDLTAIERFQFDALLSYT